MKTVSITVDVIEGMRLFDWALRGLELDANIRSIAMQGIVMIPPEEFESSTTMIADYPSIRALAITLNRAIRDSSIDERKELVREIPKRFGSPKR